MHFPNIVLSFGCELPQIWDENSLKILCFPVLAWGLSARLHYGGLMRIRMLTIVSVGITIGLLLGMSTIGLIRAALDGKTLGLEIAFTSLVAFMAAVLISYVFKSTR